MTFVSDLKNKLNDMKALLLLELDLFTTSDMQEKIDEMDVIIETFFNLDKRKKINKLIESLEEEIKECNSPILMPASKFANIFEYELDKTPRLIPQYIRNAFKRRGIFFRKLTKEDVFEVWTKKTKHLRVIREK